MMLQTRNTEGQPAIDRHVRSRRKKEEKEELRGVFIETLSLRDAAKNRAWCTASFLMSY